MLNVKDLYGLFQQAGKINEYQKILELLDDSFKAREKIVELESENIDLRQQLELKGQRLHERNSYWLIIESGKKDGPYCTCCWDDLGKPIRLHPRPSGSHYNCPKCKSQVEIYPERNPMESPRVVHTDFFR